MEKVEGKAIHCGIGGLPFLSCPGPVEQWVIFTLFHARSLLAREC